MQNLPNADLAYVEDGKLSGYLLDPRHERGAAKRRFLEANGFDAVDVDAIRSALLRHGRDNEVMEVAATPFGVKYRVDGPMPTPTGAVLRVRTVWQVDAGQTAPRFVTMKPL